MCCLRLMLMVCWLVLKLLMKVWFCMCCWSGLCMLMYGCCICFCCLFWCVGWVFLWRWYRWCMCRYVWCWYSWNWSVFLIWYCIVGCVMKWRLLFCLVLCGWIVWLCLMMKFGLLIISVVCLIVSVLIMLCSWYVIVVCLC